MGFGIKSFLKKTFEGTIKKLSNQAEREISNQTNAVMRQAMTAGSNTQPHYSPYNLHTQQQLTQGIFQNNRDDGYASLTPCEQQIVNNSVRDVPNFLSYGDGEPEKDIIMDTITMHISSQYPNEYQDKDKIKQLSNIVFDIINKNRNNQSQQNRNDFGFSGHSATQPPQQQQNYFDSRPTPNYPQQHQPQPNYLNGVNAILRACLPSAEGVDFLDPRSMQAYVESSVNKEWEQKAESGMSEQDMIRESMANAAQSRLVQQGMQNMQHSSSRPYNIYSNPYHNRRRSNSSESWGSSII